jgi:hypothetical protein
MAKADWNARVVWVPKAIDHNAPASPNVVLSWADAWDRIPECQLKLEAWQTLGAFLQGMSEGFREAFAKACPKPSVMPSRIQDQEQEQDLSLPPARAREPDPNGNQPPEPPTPRQMGEAARLAILAPRPLTAELLAELERRGFECGPPAKATTAASVERAVAEVGVPLAADRVMAVVAQDRAASVVPHDTLGWHLDAIRGQPEGGSRPPRSAGPARHVDAWEPAPALPPSPPCPLFTDEELSQP